MNTFYKLQLNKTTTLSIKETSNEEKFNYDITIVGTGVRVFLDNSYTSATSIYSGLLDELSFCLRVGKFKDADTLYKTAKSLMKFIKKHDIEHDVLCSLENEANNLIKEITVQEHCELAC